MFGKFGFLYITGMLLLSGVPIASQAQSDFDPAHPFSRVKTPEEWVKQFTPSKPTLVSNDPYGNMTSDEFHWGSWKGQNIDDPSRTPASVKGSGGGKGPDIHSPYPYTTAREQYDAWLAAAHEGATVDRLPDWSGDWQGRSFGVLSGNTRVSEILTGVSDAYKARYIQLLRAEWLGHIWLSTEFCLPASYAFYWNTSGATSHFMRDGHMVLMNKDKDEMATRYVYTDGRGFLPQDKTAPAWYGQSEGFWDGDELVVYTKSYRRFVMSNARPEYSDKLETVERWKRFGDKMLVDITLYDSEAFAFPWHDIAVFHTLKDWTEAPATYTECVSSNNVYLAKDGMEQERVPGEPDYKDISDQRPWATAYKLWDAAHPSVPQWTVPK